MNLFFGYIWKVWVFYHFIDKYHGFKNQTGPLGPVNWTEKWSNWRSNRQTSGLIGFVWFIFFPFLLASVRLFPFFVAPLDARNRPLKALETTPRRAPPHPPLPPSFPLPTTRSQAQQLQNSPTLLLSSPKSQNIATPCHPFIFVFKILIFMFYF